MNILNKIKSIFSKKENEQLKQQGIDIDGIKMSERISFENQMKKVNPRGESIHYVGKSKILLSELMEKAAVRIDMNSVCNAYAIVEHWGGKSWHQIENIAEYSPQDDMINVNDKGGWYIKGSGMNLIVHLIYKEEDHSGYLTVHIRCHGKMGEDAVFYNHVTFFHKRPGTHSTELKRLKYSMDEHDQRILFDDLSMKRLKAEEKRQFRQQLTPQERELLGMPVHPQLVLQRAKSKMEENRWGDAIADLLPVYEMLKQFIMEEHLGKQWYEVLSDACLSIATCYYHKGFYVKAFSYLRYATNRTQKKTAAELSGKCIDNYLKSDGTPSLHQFSLMLQTFFDIIPSELSAMTWIDNNTMESGNIDKQRDIWEYDMKEAMKERDELSLYISYRSHRSILDDEFVDVEDIRRRKAQNPDLNENFLRSVTIACTDRSICEVDSVVIVHLSKQNNLITMNAMLPGFSLEPQYEPKTMTLDFSEHDLVSHEECNAIQERANKKVQDNEPLNEQDRVVLVSNQNAVWHYCNGWAAFDKRLWGDVIYYLLKTFTYMSYTWHQDEVNEYEGKMMIELDYKLGYAYADLHLYDYALFYLEKFADFSPCRYTVEYINCLVNSRDLYAWNIVNNELKKLATDKSYLNDEKDNRHGYELFLRRRLGHMLIDKERYAEARKCFESLLGDPESRPYALKGLQYIESIEQYHR